MKKIYTILHDEKIQGNLVIGFVFAIVLAIVVLTAGK